jgi:hypothetical protein
MHNNRGLSAFKVHMLTRHDVPDFWGPASNFGIPIAAVMDTQKDPDMYVLDYSIPRSQRPPYALYTQSLLLISHC